MYLMQTVSTVPRARPFSARRSRSMDRNGEVIREDFSVQYPPPVRRAAPDPAEPKKKEKKWSLGGFFRRRKKGADSESSSLEEEDPAPRKGFLARRRSRREKRKQRTKIVGTFDHVVVNPLSQPPRSVNGAVDTAGRASRDSLGGSVDRLSSRSSRESLPQQHRRQDSSLSRNSSGGSGSLEGSCRRGSRRDMVKARVEAIRDQQRAESSSDECDGFPKSPTLTRFRSDDSLSGLQRDGSFNKRSRVARTERYIRRLSRDEEGLLRREAEIDPQQRQRMCKSDAEGCFNRSPINRGPGTASNRWAATVLYQESSDMEPRFLTRTPSATPSPAQSPLVRHKHLVQYVPSIPPVDSAMSTFPPSHYHGPLINKSPPQNSGVRLPARSYSARGLSPASSNKICEPVIVHAIPRSRVEVLPNRQNINYENMYGKVVPSNGFEFQNPGQRSHSYDSNIHHVSNFGPNLNAPSAVTGADDVMVVQFPLVRPQSLGRGNSASPSMFKQGPPPPPPRDPQRRLPSQQDPPRPMSYAFENGSAHTSRLEYSLSHGSQPIERSANLKSFSFVPQSHIMTNIPSTGSAWTGGYQRRSNSDNQLAAQFAQHTQNVRPQITIPRARPSSVTPEPIRPLPQQNQNRVVSRTPPDFSNPPKPQVTCNQQFQYFADQQPRSRKPIHIQCNSTVSDQPYLSDSQVVVMKPPYQDRRNPILNATEFWRQKEQEGVVKQRKPTATKPPLQYCTRSDRSRSNSPRPKEHSHPEGVRSRLKLRVPPLSFPVRPTDSLSSLSGQSDISSPVQPPKMFADGPSYDSCESSGGGTHPLDSLRKKDGGSLRPLSMVLENTEGQEQNSPSSSPVNEEVSRTFASVLEAAPLAKPVPPAPPTRRFSRQSSTSSIDANEWMGDDGNSENNIKKKRKSSNLEDALNELEAIYNSLKLGDEDLLDRAERRDLPTIHQQRRDSLSQTVPSWNISRGAESDSGFNYGYGSSYDSVFDVEPRHRRQRAPSMRRSGIPDKVADDMAYRRLNPKERVGSQDVRSMVSQSGSYMLASPALTLNPEATHQRPGSSIIDEPDITFDDVVFRNIRHANNTLKINDPQPPFGIPLGPIAPAANSDYLHATPVDRYRPTFKPRKIPDVVKDDLAYRNLRKDSQKESSALPPIDGEEVVNSLNAVRNENSNFSLRKKRAVRSLSANLMNLVHKEPLSVLGSNKEQEFEKAQSLTDLPDALQVAQKILEGKEVIGGGSVKLRNIPSSSVELPSTKRDASGGGSELDTHYGVAPVSWVERANLGAGTSTETLTDSRTNLQPDAASKRSSWQQRLRVYIPTSVETGGGGQVITPEKNKPPLAVSEDPSSPIDEGQLEDLLSALAREARATSEKLDQELQQLVGESAAVNPKHTSVLDVNLKVAILAENSKVDSQLNTVINKSEPDGPSKHKLSTTIDIMVKKDIPTVPTPNLQISGCSTVNINQVAESNIHKEPLDIAPEDEVGVEHNEEAVNPLIDNDYLKQLNEDPALSCIKESISALEKSVAEEEMKFVSEVMHERDGGGPKEITPSLADECGVSKCQNYVDGGDESDVLLEDGVDECLSKKKEQAESVQKPGPSERQRDASEGEDTPSQSACSWYLDPATILVACSYCIACTHNFVGLDVFAVLGILLAVLSFLAVLVL